MSVSIVLLEDQGLLKKSFEKKKKKKSVQTHTTYVFVHDAMKLKMSKFSSTYSFKDMFVCKNY